jgi:exodeoxyribonuclease VII small subunit
MAKKEENFEELMKKLEEITNKLEKEELNLDESVELFEEGMKISKQCSSKLQNAEKRITMLLNTDTVEEENFIPED